MEKFSDKTDWNHEIRRVLLDELLPQLINDHGHQHWRLHDGSDLGKGLIYKRDHVKYGTVWKLSLALDVSAKRMHEFLSKSHHDEKSWVPFVHQLKVHEAHADWSIIQQTAKGILTISDRDTVLYRVNGQHGDCYYQVWSSCKNQEMYSNLSNNSVRAIANPCGIVLKPHGSSSCLFNYIHSWDLQGSFHKWTLDIANSTFLQEFAKAAKHQVNKLNGHTETSSDTVFAINKLLNTGLRDRLNSL